MVGRTTTVAIFGVVVIYKSLLESPWVNCSSFKMLQNIHYRGLLQSFAKI